MNHTEILKLWRQYETEKSPEIRDKLILEYKPIVEMIAKRLAKILYQEELDDLVSDGYLGLINAVDHFDSSKIDKFNSYLSKKVYGAILDGVRHRNHYRGGEHRKVQKIPFYENASELENMIYDHNVEDIVEVIYRAEIIQHGLALLPEEDRKMVWLYFYSELTQKEIADMLGYHDSWISQRISKSLTIMRTEFEKLGIQEEGQNDKG